jgi:hypothetical protein
MEEFASPSFDPLVINLLGFKAQDPSESIEIRGGEPRCCSANCRCNRFQEEDPGYFKFISTP